MKRLIWILEAVLVVVVSFPLAVLPYKSALKAGEALGFLFFYAWAGRRRIAVENIERVIRAGALEGTSLSASPFETASRIARASFINLGKSLAEVVRIYYGFGDALVHNVIIKGEEHYSKAKAKGKGIIVVTGHCGNWELTALAFGVKVAPGSGVARALDNPYINGMIAKIRSRYGNSLIYKKGALKGVLSCLKKEGVVSILMDQAVVPDEGFIIDFLGRGAWTSRMPALIARKTGAPVIPVFMSREGAGHVMTIYPEAPLRYEDKSENALKEDTRLLSRYVEDYIKLHPSEWLWLHRRWKRVEEHPPGNGGEGQDNKA